jgi:hypothetical protein
VADQAQTVVEDPALSMPARTGDVQLATLGLAFSNKDSFIVSGQGRLWAFSVPAPESPPLSCSDARAMLRIEFAEDRDGATGFNVLAAADDVVFFSCPGDADVGWLGRARLEAGTPGLLQPAVSTAQTSGIPAPFALTISPQGCVVVGQIGRLNVDADGLLVFYDAATARRLLKLQTGLRDTTGLAYAPGGQLYAVDYSAAKPEEGGLFHVAAELQQGRQTIKTTKLVSLDRPTSIAAAGDGALLVTVHGGAQPGEQPSGKLLKIIP